ncbi:Histone acetyltransferase [Schizosaccharomyces pombe]
MPDLWSESILEGRKLSIYHLKSTLEKCPFLFGQSKKSKDFQFGSHLFLVEEQNVFIFGMECIVYEKNKEFIVFVSKADSTGFGSKGVSCNSLAFCCLVTLIDGLRKQGAENVTLTLFAIAQGQYLFPESVDNGQKHVLNDSGLLRWWVNCLEKLRKYYTDSEAPNDSEKQKNSTLLPKAYLFVPGLENIRSYLPNRHWIEGNAITTGKAVEELPRFPDDPKCRYLCELQDEKSDMSVEEFWDTLTYRQECSSGKLVGFFTLQLQFYQTREFIAKDNFGDSGVMIPAKLYRVTYDTLLKHPFGSLSDAQSSTEKFLSNTLSAVQNLKDFHYKRYKLDICGLAKRDDRKNHNHSKPATQANILQPRKKVKK